MMPPQTGGFSSCDAVDWLGRRAVVLNTHPRVADRFGVSRGERGRTRRLIPGRIPRARVSPPTGGESVDTGRGSRRARTTAAESHGRRRATTVGRRGVPGLERTLPIGDFAARCQHLRAPGGARGPKWRRVTPVRPESAGTESAPAWRHGGHFRADKLCRSARRRAPRKPSMALSLAENSWRSACSDRAGRPIHLTARAGPDRPAAAKGSPSGCSRRGDGRSAPGVVSRRRSRRRSGRRAR